MICRFNFFLTEVPIIKKPVHCFAEQIISKIYTEPSGFLFWKVNLELSWTKKNSGFYTKYYG